MEAAAPIEQPAVEAEATETVDNCSSRKLSLLPSQSRSQVKDALQDFEVIPEATIETTLEKVMEPLIEPDQRPSDS